MTRLVRVADELSQVALGDARLDRRAKRIGELLAASPGESFPEQTRNDAELEALYRFLSNEDVVFEDLLAPHIEMTVARAIAAQNVVVIHDTTVFSFGGETAREGLGRIKKGGQGFSAHVALVADLDDGVPLGVLGLVQTTRDQELQPRANTRSKRYEGPREFDRWEALLADCVERLDGSHPIHVMDREGDAYRLLSKLHATNHRFVVRAKASRALAVPRGDTEQPRTLGSALTQTTHAFTRDVQLSTKRPDKMARLRKVPARMSRMARLEVSTTSVALRHPPYTAGKSRKGSTLPYSVPVHVVHVYEPDHPQDQEPVEWTLYTNLPIDTVEQTEIVVDAYRRRWLIEEYFKALKTGCAFEKRQLETKHALLNALALFVPIAWRLLALRHLSRVDIDIPASKLLNERQLIILKTRAKVPLSASPTIREATLAIAAEGGHIKNNGDPGWQVLGRGYEKLLHMEAGFVLGQASK